MVVLLRAEQVAQVVLVVEAMALRLQILVVLELLILAAGQAEEVQAAQAVPAS